VREARHLALCPPLNLLCLPGPGLGLGLVPTSAPGQPGENRDQLAAPQAAAETVQLAGSALQAAAAPFDVFDGSWGLNILFFGILATLAYSLIVVAPRQ
jgi:hypothetical protein